MTNDELFAWVMHRFAEVFREHAILKGGMALRLLDSPRSTNDIDYIFVPYASKKEILPDFSAVLSSLEGVHVSVDVHSKMIRAILQAEGAAIQIEANVAPACRSIPMATGDFARKAGYPSRIVRVMDLSVALAHKLAAWNERRLTRDLYDAYFLFGRAGAKPDREVLEERLSHVVSRLPVLRGRKKMRLSEFLEALSSTIAALDEGRLEVDLGPLLPPEERAGLVPRLKAALSGVIQTLEG
jgi:predicted nucleotidyltransferase component of viral defense system